MSTHLFNRSKITLFGFISCILTLLTPIYAQKDFDHYSTLLSSGPVPHDFTTPPAEKVKQDLGTYESDLPLIKKRAFLQSIHYNVAEILNSGNVIYGDDITSYVEAVGKNLIKNEQGTLGKLRFYTIKSNVSNAFSTDQGMIFITTGLIAQLTSEAQLAFILSHEIVHFSEKHVRESFEVRQTKIPTSDRIRILSAHSHENEFEADKLALKRYYDAGYNDDEIVSVFDVLMYSYLPFDEVPFTKDYYSSSVFYVPDNLFPQKKYPIKTDEDYDDTRSSHPNIRKRKDAVLEAIKAYHNWGNAVNTLGDTRFNYVRNLSRFESVRTNIIEGQYAQALYSVFLLEKEFPQSVYLQQIKAHAWLGLVQLKKEGKMQETLLTSQNYEGESAAIHYFLNKLNLNGYLTFSLRQIYDIRQRFPEDTVILLIEQSLLKFLAKTDKFNLSDYSNLNFHESSEARTKALSEHAPKTSASDTVALTKYEKIRSKRNVNTPENFDSTKYYLYDLSDIIADSLFCAKFHSYRKSYNEYKSELATTKQSAKGWNGPDHTESQNELHNLLVLTPVSSCEHQKKGPLWTKKDACEKYMWLALTETARKTKVSTTQIEKTDKSTESSGLNHRGLVYSLVEQSSINTDAEIVPVDFHLLKAIELQTGSSNVLISYSNYYYEPKLNGLFFLACIVCPPFLFYIPVAAVQAHELSTSVLVLELTTGKVNSSAYLYKHGQPSKQRFLKVYKEVFKKMVTTN